MKSVDIKVIQKVIIDIVTNNYEKYRDNKHYIITLGIYCVMVVLTIV